MPASTLYRAGMAERFLFDVDKQQREQDVEVRLLQRGALPIRSFRLADDPDVLEVRVASGDADLIAATVEWTERIPRCRVPMTSLPALARLLAAWLDIRHQFAAYVGAGLVAKYFGYVPLVYYPRGVAGGERIRRDDPRLPVLRAAARATRLVPASNEVLGDLSIETALLSGIDERVGVVLHGPLSLVVVLGRGAAVIDADPDPSRITALAVFVASGGYAANPFELREIRGLSVRPDAVQVIAQAAALAID